MMELRNISAGYGGSTVLHDVSLKVKPGELTALLGINGAGKTTLINTIMGLIKPTIGEIILRGRNITQDTISFRCQNGIVCVPEDRGLFPNLTVLENLKVGYYAGRKDETFDARLAECYDLFPKLYERRKQIVASQSGGEQQMLALARGLMAGPKYLLLDEPTLGLSPMMMDGVFKLIETLRNKGIRILLVEQNMHRSVTVADEVYLLVNGHITDHATAADIAQNPKWLDRAMGV